jgi:GT2 family glycosyltransferase
MQEDNLLVSIIVRTKDRPVLLKRAIASIAGQTYSPIEVVLVNDGGCDLDVDELKHILGNVTLNYIRLEENTGRAHTANVGIENAHGNYIGLLDDDDEFYPEHIQILTEKLKDDDLKIAYTDAEMVFAEFHDELMVEMFRYVYYSHEFSPEALLLQNYIPFMCLLFPRNVFDETRFDETFDFFEDWVFLIELSQKYWFRHIKKVTAKYTQWSDESQINRRALSEKFSRDAYLRVLDLNVGKISSETIYTYCVYNATEKQKYLDELIKKEADYFKEKMEMTDELMKLRSEKIKLELRKQHIEQEKKQIEIENENIQQELTSLRQELTGLRNDLAEISGSLGWNLIEKYRRLKEKIIPPGTKRRGAYNLLLKSIKVLRTEGTKGFSIRAGRKSSKSLNRIKFRLRIKRNRSFYTTAASNGSEMCDFGQKPIHIIMPVYNGYDCLVNCINSVFRNTDLFLHTLVIIDDRSTDGRVREYLENIRKERNGRNISIIYNRKNSGFTKTANKGMQLSYEDLIILNSDTIVTKNWVNKLQRAAYSKLRIATATPLSNYITINGIPEAFRYNTIPNGLNVDSFADVLEKISLRYYPEIPAGVGFCLYIKRSVLDEMGYFDEEKFGRGYAEETDFCMRALKKGYIHVIDDATYIYHVGGVSFESVKDPEILKEKNLMIEKNLETLKTLHPEYANLVESALHENLSPIHTYINSRLKSMEDHVESPLRCRSEA